MQIMYLSVVLLLAAVSFGADAIDRPSNLGRPRGENPGNLTIDQAILGTIDPNAPSSYSSPDGKVLAELDMWLSAEQYAALYSADGGRTKRTAIRDPALRWTDKTIPYMFYSQHFPVYQQYWIRRAMTDYERWTCMKFRPATKADVNWVRFQNGQGCNSQLGMYGGMQGLNLETPGCRWKGLYLHEIGHAIGMVHEHQRPDRDDWITVNYNNVDEEMRVWFKKYSTEKVDTMGTDYEYSSIMHYGITAFSAEQKQTIFAKYKDREDEIGRVYLKELAFSDVDIINKMYKCGSHCPDQTKCGADGVLDENCRCVCKDGSHDTCDQTLTADSSCTNKDNSWKCYIWATQGECEKNPRYMNYGCAKACGQCGKKTPSTPSPCKNNYQDKKCNMWKKRGDCVTNKWWMTQHCPVACNFCTKQDTEIQEKCTNKHDLTEKDDKCFEWAHDGECVLNPAGMFIHCRSSCMACNNTEGHVGFGETEISDTHDLDIDPYECVDRNDQCRGWAAGDQCDANAGWMIDNCRKACGKCDDGSCKDLWSDTECIKWAGEGECTASPDWMGKNCAQSCGVGLCEGQPTNIPRTPYPKPQTTAPAKICKNDHNDKECDDWAATKQCSLNPGYMLKHCAGSCRVCGGGTDIDDITPVKICKNDHNDKECDMWAAGNQCSLAPGYMLRFCAGSCRVCGGGTDIDDVPAKICKNDHNDKECDDWAATNQCSLNPGYMLKHCAGSCRVCGGGTDIDDAINKPHPNCQDKHQSCKAWKAAGDCDTSASSSVLKLCQFSCDNCGCKDESDQCAVWAQTGACSTNAQYMMRSCQKACGVC